MHPILFSIAGFPIGTYGLLLTVGFLLALALAKALARRDGIAPGSISDLAITLLIAGIVGSKLLMLIVDIIGGASLNQILDPGYLRAGGAVHGGIIAATVAFFWSVRRLKLPLAGTLDCLTPAVALGQAIGRLGCFAAGCCYGTACDAPWAVTFTNPDANLLSGTPLHLAIHPVQLYTFLANMTILALLLGVKKHRRFVGQVSACYFVLEGIGRMVTEIWRADLDRGVWMGLSWLSTGRLTAFLFVLFGAGLWGWFASHRQTEVNS